MQINSKNFSNIITPAIAVNLAGYDAVKNSYQADDNSKANAIIQDTVCISAIIGCSVISNKTVTAIKAKDFYKNCKINENIKNYAIGVFSSLLTVTPGVFLKEFLDKQIPVKKKEAAEKDKILEYFKVIDTGIGGIKKAYSYSGVNFSTLDVPMGAIDTTDMITEEKKTGLDKIKDLGKNILIGPIVPMFVASTIVTPFISKIKEKGVKPQILAMIGGVLVGITADIALNKLVDKLTPSKEMREKVINEISKRQKDLIKLDLINNSLYNFKQQDIDTIMRNLNDMKKQVQQVIPLKTK
ncbi:MAG: hypothetical protein WCK67_09660 [bacterium]